MSFSNSGMNLTTPTPLGLQTLTSPSDRAKRFATNIFTLVGNAGPLTGLRMMGIARKYRSHTMISPTVYFGNLLMARRLRETPGCVVECGTWRGGMIAGFAEIFGPDRTYHVFDSFEGMPPAEPIDGALANSWQQDTESPFYLDNARADQSYCERAMQSAGATGVHIHKGWFEDTLPDFVPDEPIALLHLDCDWFESIITCLQHLFDHLAPDAWILVDDYYLYDGCRRAIHRFLSDRNLPLSIEQPYKGICAIQITQDALTTP